MLTRIYRFSGWPSTMHSGYNDIWPPPRFDKDFFNAQTIQSAGKNIISRYTGHPGRSFSCVRYDLHRRQGRVITNGFLVY